MFQKKLIQCSIEGCDRPSRSRGLCWMHYERIRTGISDMRPEKLNSWNTGKREADRNSNKHCSLCRGRLYAKGFCKNHYELIRRTGTAEHKNKRFEKCIVYGCDNLGPYSRKGLCNFHKRRANAGHKLDDPPYQRLRGEGNHNWNGGRSEYPNHYTLKKIRKQRLAEENYTCQLCKSHADQTHHTDGSKDNHDPKNLLVLCRKCHFKFFHRKPHISKWKRIYGMNLEEIRKELCCTTQKIYSLHEAGELHIYLSLDGSNTPSLTPATSHVETGPSGRLRPSQSHENREHAATGGARVNAT